MKRQGADPILYVVVGLVVLALLSTLAAVAGRSCAKTIGDFLASLSISSGAFGSLAGNLEQRDYEAFVKEVERIDLGIGIHVGMSKSDVLAMLGKPDFEASHFLDDYYQLDYSFPPGLRSLDTKARILALEGNDSPPATLTISLRNDEVAGISFYLPSTCTDTSRWDYLTLNGKPFSQCKTGDVHSLLGKPIDETETDASWEFYPAEAGPQLATSYKTSDAPPSDAVILSQADYDAYAKNARDFDFGIGVHLGQSWSELRKVMGKPDCGGIIMDGIRSCSYMLPLKSLDSTPPNPKAPCALLMFELKDEIVRHISLSIPDTNKNGDYPYLLLNGKSLADCSINDFKQVFGEETHNNTNDDYCHLGWAYASEPSVRGPRRFTEVTAWRTMTSHTFNDITITDINSTMLYDEEAPDYMGAFTIESEPTAENWIYVYVDTGYSADNTLRHLKIKLHRPTVPETGNGTTK